MYELTKIEDNVYQRHELLHAKLNIEDHVDMESLFPTDLSKRYTWVRYLESKYSGYRPTSRVPWVDMSDWTKYRVQEIIGKVINKLLTNRYSEITRPYVFALRLDLTLRNIYILVRTVYGPKTCIDRLSF